MSHHDLTFPQRIRFAGHVLREVAEYRSRTIHGESGGVNENSTWTLYTAGQLDMIADKVEEDERAERDIEIEELARALAGIDDVVEWPKSLYVSEYRKKARELWDQGWRKDGDA